MIERIKKVISLRRYANKKYGKNGTKRRRKRTLLKGTAGQTNQVDSKKEEPAVVKKQNKKFLLWIFLIAIAFFIGYC